MRSKGSLKIPYPASVTIDYVSQHELVICRYVPSHSNLVNVQCLRLPVVCDICT